MTFEYVGTKSEAQPLYAPFDALGPASREEGTAPYPELGGKTGTSSADPLCAKGFSHVQYPVGLLEYNITTQREVYEYFKATTLKSPQYNGSTVVLETYSVVGMKAVPGEDSAYPHRADNILV
jgi:hypothetical protein